MMMPQPRLQQGDQFTFDGSSGGSSTGQPPAPQDTSFFDGDEWQNWFAQQLGEDIINAGIAAGEDPTAMAGLFQNNFDELLKKIDQNLFFAGNLTPGSRYANIELYTTTTDGWNKLIDYGRTFYGSLNNAITPFVGQPRKTGGYSGGGGTTSLTPEQIRNQFDVDQLSNQANLIKRGLTLEPFSDPRGIARAYIDAVVAGKGEKKIDFDTFVEERVKETGRFKAIFRNLPPGLDPRQYIAPLYQQALGADPNTAVDRTVGAAQFGASAAQFQERLNKEDAVTGSAPFINKMQNRLSQLKGVLKG